MLHVPPPTFTSRRPIENVFVSNPFTAYVVADADIEPTGKTTSADTASAGHAVSTLKACSAPTAALATPITDGDPGV